MQLPARLSHIRDTSKSTVFVYRHPLHNSGKPKQIKLVAKTHQLYQIQFKQMVSAVEKYNADAAKIKTNRNETAVAIEQHHAETSSLTFAHVADLYFEEWERETSPAQKTKSDTVRANNFLKATLGICKISTITTRMCAETLNASVSLDGYRDCRSFADRVFKYAKQNGYCDNNPAADTKTKKQVTGIRLPMTMEQFNALYEAAPDWMQCAMDIAMETSLRPIDVRSMKWCDIHGDKLIVLPVKTAGIDKRASRNGIVATSSRKLAFDLSKNKRLANAIDRAKEIQDHTQIKRSIFKDCPYIVARTNVKKVCAGKEMNHPLYLTDKEFDRVLRIVRDEVHAKTKLFYHNGIEYTSAQMPSWYGIRKLSLWNVYKMYGIDAARERADHNDVETTIKHYLVSLDSSAKDVTFVPNKVSTLKVIK